MPIKLTNTLAKKAEVRKRRYHLADSLYPGLTLTVYPSGTKTYYYKYKIKGSKKNNLHKLGNAAIMSVDAARTAAGIAQADMARGINLIARHQEQAKNEAFERESKQQDNDLRLFNYIDKYYKPYAEKKNKDAEEYCNSLRREFGDLKDKRIDQIDGSDIDRWRKKRSKNVSHATLKRKYNTLRACINTAIKKYKLIDKHALENYSMKRYQNEKASEKKLRYLLPEEEPKLLDALAWRDQEQRSYHTKTIEWQLKRNPNLKYTLYADDEYPDYITPIILIAYHTGFDIGDIFDFDWQKHIDMTNRQIIKTRNKTKDAIDNPKPVVMTMSTVVYEALTQWGKQHGQVGRVFSSEVTGGRIKNINHQWNKIKNKAELIDFRLKDLRHTFGSLLALADTYPTVIRDLMGHTDLKTTEIYLHLCPSHKKNAVLSVFG